MVTRSSQTESGLVHKGAKDMPCPGGVLGGPYLTLSKAKDKSNHELRQYIRRNLPKYLQRVTPVILRSAVLKRARRNFDLRVRKLLGSPLRSEAALRKALDANSFRQTILRALAADLPSDVLWRCAPGGNVDVAINVGILSVSAQSIQTAIKVGYLHIGSGINLSPDKI